MPLRRLTKFSELELETREGRARADDRGADGDPRRRRRCCARSSATSSPRSPSSTAPRGARCCWSRPGSPSTSAVPLEVSRRPVPGAAVVDRPAGAHAATTSRSGAAVPAPSTTSSSPSRRATARGTVGVVTSAGRLVKLDVLDLPALPADGERARSCRAAPRSPSSSPLEPGERAGHADVARRRLARARARHRARRRQAGPARGAQQPRLVGRHPARRRRRGGRRGRAARAPTTSSSSSPPTPSCCTSRPPAVRPQGRSGGGIAGVRLAAGRRVGLLRRARRRAPTTSSSPCPGRRTRCPGTEAGHVKVTPFAEYPGKGRGTGGVRCHRFLKGEDTLLVAAVAAGPGQGRGRQRRPGRPPGGARPPRRLRHPGRPADRRPSPGSSASDARRGLRMAGCPCAQNVDRDPGHGRSPSARRSALTGCKGSDDSSTTSRPTSGWPRPRPASTTPSTSASP